MVIQTTRTLNGIEYDYTYSDAGRYIVRDGISYGEAYDPLNSGRVYTEGDPIEQDEPGEAEEILEILLGEESGLRPRMRVRYAPS